MLTFDKRILFIGFGSVARCTLPILLKHVGIKPESITIIDFNPDEEALAPWIAKGIVFAKERITPEAMGQILAKRVSEGDLVIDLAWNIDSCEIISWCHDHGVMYINTSVELWDPYAQPPGTHPSHLTLYWRHMALRKLRDSWDRGCSILPTPVCQKRKLRASRQKRCWSTQKTVSSTISPAHSA